MLETETPIFTIQSEITKASIDNLSKAITAFSRSISSICFSDQFIEISALLSAISNSMILLAEKAGIPQNSFDFLKEFDFQSEHIELTEENCNSINNLSKLSSAENPVIVTPNSKTPTIQFVISILIPIIIGLLQMGQNAYYHHQSSIESKIIQDQEQEYQEQLLKILTDICSSMEQSTPSDEPAHQCESPAHMPGDQSHNAPAE